MLFSNGTYFLIMLYSTDFPIIDKVLGMVYYVGQGKTGC
jgi:hypothetical protein